MMRLLAAALVLAACSPARAGSHRPGFLPHGNFGEAVRSLDMYPGVTATIVSPASLDTRKRVDLILYALPNGNTTAQTMGRRLADGVDWHYDIQHIGAQTRALRERGLHQAVVVYLEADKRSWPAWRSTLGYDRANPRIVEIVDQVRSAIGNPTDLSLTLTGHSANTLVVLAYDDREVTFEGKKVEILLHPNPANRILHTEMIGEMNGYMHALLVRRAGYERLENVLVPRRAYDRWVEPDVSLPAATPPDIPERKRNAVSGSAFIASIAALPREDREAATKRELLAGNIPSFLRRLQRIEVTAPDSNGVTHTIQYDVMPDYLAIGSDRDFVRMPMTPYTAQAFCDAFGFVLPTRRMVGDIWMRASIKVEPRPLTEKRESPLTFLQHQQIIEQQLKGRARESVIAGMKKDIVVTPKLERSDRVAIFGWHRENGEPIQPLYSGHADWYVDYSHGARPVRRKMIVDGVIRTFEDVLSDPKLRYLLSDENGPPISRYR
jgi:hypothetical protein